MFSIFTLWFFCRFVLTDENVKYVEVGSYDEVEKILKGYYHLSDNQMEQVKRTATIPFPLIDIDEDLLDAVMDGIADHIENDYKLLELGKRYGCIIIGIEMEGTNEHISLIIGNPAISNQVESISLLGDVVIPREHGYPINLGKLIFNKLYGNENVFGAFMQQESTYLSRKYGLDFISKDSYTYWFLQMEEEYLLEVYNNPEEKEERKCNENPNAWVWSSRHVTMTIETIKTPSEGQNSNGNNSSSNSNSNNNTSNNNNNNNNNKNALPFSDWKMVKEQDHTYSLRGVLEAIFTQLETWGNDINVPFGGTFFDPTVGYWNGKIYVVLNFAAFPDIAYLVGGNPRTRKIKEGKKCGSFRVGEFDYIVSFQYTGGMFTSFSSLFFFFAFLSLLFFCNF